jgi:hypothetical protein
MALSGWESIPLTNGETDFGLVPFPSGVPFPVLPPPPPILSVGKREIISDEDHIGDKRSRIPQNILEISGRIDGRQYTDGMIRISTRAGTAVYPTGFLRLAHAYRSNTIQIKRPRRGEWRVSTQGRLGCNRYGGNLCPRGIAFTVGNKNTDYVTEFDSVEDEALNGMEIRENRIRNHREKVVTTAYKEVFTVHAVAYSLMRRHVARVEPEALENEGKDYQGMAYDTTFNMFKIPRNLLSCAVLFTYDVLATEYGMRTIRKKGFHDHDIDGILNEILVTMVPPLSYWTARKFSPGLDVSPATHMLLTPPNAATASQVSNKPADTVLLPGQPSLSFFPSLPSLPSLPSPVTMMPAAAMSHHKMEKGLMPTPRVRRVEQFLTIESLDITAEYLKDLDL